MYDIASRPVVCVADRWAPCNARGSTKRTRMRSYSGASPYLGARRGRWPSVCSVVCPVFLACNYTSYLQFRILPRREGPFHRHAPTFLAFSPPAVMVFCGPRIRELHACLSTFGVNVTASSPPLQRLLSDDSDTLFGARWLRIRQLCDIRVSADDLPLIAPCYVTI